MEGSFATVFVVEEARCFLRFAPSAKSDMNSNTDDTDNHGLERIFFCLRQKCTDLLFVHIA